MDGPEQRRDQHAGGRRPVSMNFEAATVPPQRSRGLGRLPGVSAARPNLHPVSRAAMNTSLLPLLVPRAEFAADTVEHVGY